MLCGLKCTSKTFSVRFPTATASAPDSNDLLSCEKSYQQYTKTTCLWKGDCTWSSMVISRRAEKQWLHTPQLPATLIRYIHTNKPLETQADAKKKQQSETDASSPASPSHKSASKQASQNVFSSSCSSVESCIYFLRYFHCLYFLSKNTSYYRASIFCFYPGCRLVSSAQKTPPQMQWFWWWQTATFTFFGSDTPLQSLPPPLGLLCPNQETLPTTWYTS